MIDGQWFAIHRAAAEWLAAAPPEGHIQKGLMFKHVGVLMRLIYAVSPGKASLSWTAGCL